MHFLNVSHTIPLLNCIRDKDTKLKCILLLHSYLVFKLTLAINIFKQKQMNVKKIHMQTCHKDDFTPPGDIH